jgi:hypothetical protein
MRTDYAESGLVRRYGVQRSLASMDEIVEASDVPNLLPLASCA